MVLLDISCSRRRLKIRVALRRSPEHVGKLRLALLRNVVTVLAMPVEHPDEELSGAGSIYQVGILIGLASAVDRAPSIRARCP